MPGDATIAAAVLPDSTSGRAARRAVGARAAAALVALAVVLAGCGADDDADHRTLLLGAVPAEALARAVHLWQGDLGDGFGALLPPGAVEEVLGIGAGQVRAVAEAGGMPFTALLGDIDPDAVAQSGTAAGYDVTAVGDWMVLRPPAEPGGAAQAAIPAAAARAGVAVVGTPAEVSAVVDGQPTVADVRWAVAATEALDTPLVGLGPPLERLRAAAEVEGVDARTLLDRAGARGAMPTWEGWAVGVDGDGNGALLVVVPEGEADADAARVLALRAATGPVAGQGRRAVDVLDGGAPRFEAATGVVRLPVSWLVDAPSLRREVERGSFTFLAPRQ